MEAAKDKKDKKTKDDKKGDTKLKQPHEDEMLAAAATRPQDYHSPPTYHYDDKK